MSYRPPLRDILFVMNELLGLSELLTLEPFSHVDADDVAGLLAEAGRFNAEVVAPLNQIGDQQPSALDPEGNVTTPPGFREAYRRYQEAGWTAIQFDPDYGGGGLPWLVGIANQEFATSANMAFSLCPMLSHSAIEALSIHGSEQQKAMFLEKMITGAWTGTMNLTESQAGTDVGALITRAVARDDGTYAITGTKIFITWGEHDMAENIIHLVLARLPDAPPGTKGISLFIVPKYLVNPDGTLGAKNDVRCVSLEHKLGIKASPTAVMSFGEAGGAVGHLVGEPHQGMRYMFTMMNNARLTVGLEGLGISERSYQQAVEYARERIQGTAIESGEPTVIANHPDVRRMLITMKSSIEAMRALIYLNAKTIDESHAHPDETIRSQAGELVALLTPLSKAWCTDLGVELTSLALQVFGGMGYVEETGVAQHWRDARIAPIYEGTNGVQAVDLVLRKLPMSGGAVIERILSDIRDTVEVLKDAELFGMAEHLGAAVETVSQVTEELQTATVADRLAGATPYLRMLATLVGAWLMARGALVAKTRLDAGVPDASFYDAKLATATFFVSQTLPTAMGLRSSVEGSVDDLMAVPLDQY
ncbi:MAG: acyl-CoA dehydrogenase [Acidimicrobiia bacterium]|nr:acyl-CoA dehydrogenase [Acidimicrobiia bacterium]